MKFINVLIALVLGMSAAFSQKTIKVKFSFDSGENVYVKYEFSRDYDNVRIYMKRPNAEFYSKGYLLQVLNSEVTEDECVIFEIMGADEKKFKIAKCSDSSFALLDQDGEVTEASLEAVYDNNL